MHNVLFCFFSCFLCVFFTIFAFVFIKYYYDYDAKNVNILRNEVMFVHRHNNFPC